MTEETLKLMIQEMQTSEHIAMQKKLGECSLGLNDSLSTFKTIATDLGVRATKVCWIFLRQSLNTILRYINDGDGELEDIYKQISMARTILIFLRAIIEDDMTSKSEQKAQDVFLKRMNLG